MAGEVISLEQLPAWADAKAAQLAGLSIRPLLGVLKGLVVSDFKKNFETQSDPDGAPWAPLKSPRPGGQILYDRGILAASASTTGAPGNVDEETADGFTVGSSMVHAAIHNFGGTIVPTKGRALSIPLTPEARRAGGASLFPRKLSLVWPKGSPAGWLQEASTKGRGKKQRVETVHHYLLVSRITIPKRRFIGVGARLAAKINIALQDFALGAIGGSSHVQ